MQEPAKDKIIKARVQLQKTHPFFSYVALHLTIIETEDVPTMGVDSKANCYYNPKFVDTMTLDETKGVVCHEIMHVVLDHLKNLSGRDPKLSNVAQDICINDILVENGLRLPKEGLIPHNHTITLMDKVKIEKINEKIWEMVYDELDKKLPKPKGGKGGAGEDSWDIHIRDDKDGGASGKGAKEGKEIAKGAGKNGEDYPWKQVINEAYAYAKLQGHTPAGLDRMIDELNYPKLNWREMLQKFIVKELPYDFCYTRPSKKSMSAGIFIPSVYRENLEICVGIDTSGSIGKEDLRDALSEILGVVRAYDNVKLTALCCDAEVHTTQEITSPDDVATMDLKGGGGTSFKPVFTWIEENKPHTKLLIFFTDGCGDFPECTNIKTLWCVTKNGIKPEEFPFGEAVSLDF